MTLEKKIKKNKSGPRGEYKVVFKGNLLPGFDKQQVLANIVQLTKLPKEKIEKKFFSGKVVIIRRAHDKAHAQKLQILFTNAGLEVIILKDESQKKAEPKEASPKELKKEAVTQQLKKLPKIIKRRSRAIIAMILWGILLLVGVNLWNQYNVHVEAPDEVVQIESSLANKPLLFLAHIDLQHFLSRESYFTKNTDLLLDSQSSIYSQLKKAGIDPKNSIEQLISAAYFENKKLISQTVLLGQFHVNKVKKFFLKSYSGKMIPDADFVRLQISQINEQTCEQDYLMEVSIEPERILISSDGHLNELRRLLNKDGGNVTDLSNWSNYRSDKLVSLALFNLKQVNGKYAKSKQGIASIGGLPMMMAQNLIKKNEPVESLYAGVGLQLLPLAGVVDVTLNSKNPAWLNETQADLLLRVEDMKNQSAGLKNLQNLFSKISIEQNSEDDLREKFKGDIGHLSMKIELDSEFRQSLELSIRELMEKFLSVSISDSPSLSATNSSMKQENQERLDPSPLKFWPDYQATQIKPFNEILDQFYKPAWIDGPFAISIDELLLESHQDVDQVILQLRGKGQNIDNLGNKQAKIIVTEVNDQQSKNLLASQTCGKSANINEAFFTRLGSSKTAYLGDKKVNYNELEVRHKVKLKKGIRFSNVKILKGRVELNLATKTQSHVFAKTDQNKLLSDFDTRILFKPSGSESLSYTLSGKTNNILIVRALNKNKEYLSRVSQSSMGNLFGDGTSITQGYRGEIAFIEVVYASQVKKMTYPFEVKKFPPYPSENQWKYETEVVQSSSIARWNKNYKELEALSFSQENNWSGKVQASWHKGPLNLALYGLKTSKHWGTTGQLKIKTPVIDELRHNLSALEIFIRYPEADENGDVGRSYYYPLKAKGYYMNGEFILDRDKPYMDGQISFTLPYKNALQPMKEINGDIIIHLPVAQHSSSYTDMDIGAQWEDEGVKTKIVRLGNEVMEFEVSSNRDRLLQIVLMNSKGERISTTDIQQGLQRHGKSGNIIVNYHGIPVKALLTVSEGQQTKLYPFKLKL